MTTQGWPRETLRCAFFNGFLSCRSQVSVIKFSCILTSRRRRVSPSRHRTRRGPSLALTTICLWSLVQLVSGSRSGALVLTELYGLSLGCSLGLGLAFGFGYSL
ncbi:hypothetical protein C8R45DRAFT_957552 [Mycena sanguinolenta]|nr:hypothetical protein C8R45DRAFT_957552 [Mycena sanguinolenta]